MNPTKNELGRVAKEELASLVFRVREATKLKQCISTKDVIEWFCSLSNRKGLTFVMFDIVGFYPAISMELFNRALDWAGEWITIEESHKEIFFSSCKSFLFSGGQPWIKKGVCNFDVSMGAYQGAQICELVGLYILHKLKDVDGLSCILYRDDGLGVTRKKSKLQETMAREVKALFAREGLEVTMEINLKEVDFLDISMSLDTGLYSVQAVWEDR